MLNYEFFKVFMVIVTLIWFLSGTSMSVGAVFGTVYNNLDISNKNQINMLNYIKMLNT